MKDKLIDDFLKTIIKDKKDMELLRLLLNEKNGTSEKILEKLLKK
tara:strand:- start:102 stop:236 length:135 start_codon:yes stop_codon:yes gene_type:complete